jgi:putative oxidoreductase
MDAVIGRFSGPAYALFRIVFGLLFMLHGSQKILGWPPREGFPPGWQTPLSLAAGWIELVGGFLIAVGLFAGIAAFICSGEMAVAYFKAHFKPTAMGWIPTMNHGEDAVLYCFAFLLIAAYGAGIWSIDNARRRGVTASTGARRL